MKKCTGECGLDLPLDKFPPNKGKRDGVQSKCKKCYAVYQREYYRKRIKEDYKYKIHKREWRKKRKAVKKEIFYNYIVSYLLDHPCIDCGETDPIVLEFDHVDPSLKCFSIASKCSSEVSKIALFAEIDKCEIRCANCHRRKTYIQLGWKGKIRAIAQQQSTRFGTEE